MKAVIVNSSTLNKYRRMDAEFYTGDLATRHRLIDRARKAVADAERRLRKATRELKAEKERLQKMIADKEIVPLD